jgi:hypothetical protein
MVSGIVAYRFISTPGFFEEIVASVSRARRMTFTRVSPSEALLPVISAAEAADDNLEFEEAKRLPLHTAPLDSPVLRTTPERGHNC